MKRHQKHPSVLSDVTPCSTEKQQKMLFHGNLHHLVSLHLLSNISIQRTILDKVVLKLSAIHP